MTSLEFLARAARARIVATHFRRWRDGPSSDSRTRLSARTRGAIHTVGAVGIVARAGRARCERSFRGWWRWRCLLPHLEVVDRVHHVRPNAGLQLVEHARRFDLVFDQRIALTVRPQADAFTQIVDC